MRYGEYIYIYVHIYIVKSCYNAIYTFYQSGASLREILITVRERQVFDLRMRGMCGVIASLIFNVIFQRVSYLVADSQQ